MKKGYVNVIAIMVMVALAVLFVAVVVGNKDEIISKKNRVECRVTLKNPIGIVRIDSYSCNIVDSCLLSLKGDALSIFSDEGKVKLDMGDSSDSESFSVPEFESRIVKLSVCTLSNTGSLELVDLGGGIIQTEDVEVI